MPERKTKKRTRLPGDEIRALHIKLRDAKQEIVKLRKQMRTVRAKAFDDAGVAIARIADNYPTDVFPEPAAAESPSPEQYAAAGARLACRTALADLAALRRG